MNFKQFKYVLVLAHEGSFAKAADVLKISQPSLSQYIKKIEQQLGAELFDRTGGAVRLTDAGHAYIEAGQKILDLERQLLGRLNDLSEHKSGSVVIGTSPYRSAAMMPLIAKRFQAQYPGVHLVVEEMTSHELIESAEQGRFDLLLSLLPVNDRIFQYKKITEEELILAVPAAYAPFPVTVMPDRKYPAIDATLLNGKPFVMITEGQFMQQALENLALDYHLSLPKAAVVKSLEAQIAMVREGVGMALVPRGIERFCTADEVTFYSFKQELPRREIAAIWRKDHTPTKIVSDLIELMATLFS